MTHGIKKLKPKRKLIDVWHYFLGNYRYFFYYRPKLSWLIRVHIREQISYRITWMDSECYSNGSCKICGCETTALQMCNKQCDKPCYPPMMDKDQWHRYYTNESVVCIKSDCWAKDTAHFGKPRLLNDKSQINVLKKFY